MKEIFRRGFEICGYRVIRLRPANRFQAIEDTFTLLRKTGYLPQSVIDAGANVGAWTRAIQPIYPEAEFHLIEPQTTCPASLQELARAQSGIRLYPFAIA